MLFYNVRNKADSLRLGNSRAPLPKFWREAVNALEELTLELISDESISKEAALVEPIWYSHLFDIPQNKTTYKDLWESKLRLREIGDVLTAEGEEWTDEEVIDQIREDAGGWYGEDKSGGCAGLKHQGDAKR